MPAIIKRRHRKRSFYYIEAIEPKNGIKKKGSCQTKATIFSKARNKLPPAYASRYIMLPQRGVTQALHRELA